MAKVYPFTILVDSREKQPLRFPSHLVIPDPRDSTKEAVARLTTKKTTLATGDYQVEQYEPLVCLERKGRMEEVYQNVLTADRGRFERELARLHAEFSHPYILVEGTLSQLYQPSKRCPQPEAALSMLNQLSAQYHVPVLFLPGNTSARRRLVAQTVAHLLVGHVLASNTVSSESSTSGGQPNGELHLQHR